MHSGHAFKSIKDFSPGVLPTEKLSNPRVTIRWERNIHCSVFSSIKAASLQEILAAVASDGITAMTGIYNSAIKFVKEFGERSLQWAICLLHCNELPLRHVIQALEGSTVSPDAFIGPIEQSVKGLVSKWTICKFRVIWNSHFPMLTEDVVADLSLDQFYAYKIC